MKILTLNLRHDSSRWPERAPLIVDELAREAPDVIALQEVALSIKQAHFLVDQLHARLPQSQYWVHVAKKQGWWPNPKEGIGFLSGLPVIEHKRLKLPGGERVAQRIRVEFQGQPLDIVNTHLHHRPHDRETTRLPQAKHLLKWMFDNAPPDRRWILVGDLNATPDSSTIAKIAERLTSAYAAVHGTEPDFTAPTPLVAVSSGPKTIDYIFFDPARLRVEEVRLIGTQPHPDDPTLYASDHFGLVATLSII
jgi:endonuclease/exonuclease/phosphatase family metal-dependent hydrolase